MKLSFLLEGRGDKKLCVVYGGRFQPFHKGHYQAYRWLCKHFGGENVWIATSNKTNFNPDNGEISPFNFNERKEIITTLYDVDPRRVVQCKNPAFKPSEIFDLYKGYSIVYLAGVGKKDEDRYQNKFFHPLPSDVTLPDQLSKLLTLEDKAGYFVEVPMRSAGVSGTEVRDALVNAEPGEIKSLFKKYFGKYDRILSEMMIGKLKDVK